MIFKLAIFLILTIHLSSSVMASQDINKNMNEIAKEIDSIAPLLYNKQIAPKEKDQLVKKINKMITALENTESHFKHRGISHFFGYQSLDQHLKSTLHTLQKGNVDFALTMMKSVPLMCMNCHSADHQSKTIFTPKTVNQLNNWGQAEVAFMTRDYAQAKISYLKFLEKNPASTYKETALHRLLTLSLHEDISYQVSLQFLSTLLDKPWNSSQKSEIKNWIEGIKFLQKYESQNLLEASWKSLEKLINALKIEDFSFEGGFAEGKNLVYATKLNLLTHTALDLHPNKKDTPHLLLLLAKTEMVLRSDLFYTLADVSLKHCLKKYSSSPVAKECFKAYKDYIEFSYTGSGGVHIPKDLQLELDRYQKIIAP
jgi:hypothetical protein